MFLWPQYNENVYDGSMQRKPRIWRQTTSNKVDPFAAALLAV